MEKEICKRDVCGNIHREDVCGGDICERDICEEDICGEEIHGEEICEKDRGIKRQLLRKKDSQPSLESIKAISRKKRSGLNRVEEKNQIDAGAR